MLSGSWCKGLGLPTPHTLFKGSLTPLSYFSIYMTIKEMIWWTIFESTSQRIIMFSVHVFAKSIKCFFEAMTTSFWMVKSGQMIHRHTNFITQDFLLYLFLQILNPSTCSGPSYELTRPPMIKPRLSVGSFRSRNSVLILFPPIMSLSGLLWMGDLLGGWGSRVNAPSDQLLQCSDSDGKQNRRKKMEKKRENM